MPDTIFAAGIGRLAERCDVKHLGGAVYHT